MDLIDKLTFLAFQLIIVSKYKFRVVMLSRIYLSLALGLKIIKYVLNNSYVCPFIFINFYAKIAYGKF